MCLLTEVTGEVQSFVVRPTDQSVLQGQTALLRCQVAHMKGQLQWTKNGFALGRLCTILSSSVWPYDLIIHYKVLRRLYELLK